MWMSDVAEEAWQQNGCCGLRSLRSITGVSLMDKVDLIEYV